MTRRDYEAIASAIYLGKITTQSDMIDQPERIGDVEDATKIITLTLCEAFERDNPRFDRTKFIKRATQGTK